jgi:hypothetical protein
LRKLRKKFRGSDGLRTNMIVRSRSGRAGRTRAARLERLDWDRGDLIKAAIAGTGDPRRPLDSTAVLV